jgi:hypothetical protein
VEFGYRIRRLLHVRERAEFVPHQILGDECLVASLNNRPDVILALVNADCPAHCRAPRESDTKSCTCAGFNGSDGEPLFKCSDCGHLNCPLFGHLSEQAANWRGLSAGRTGLHRRLAFDLAAGNTSGELQSIR